MNYKNKDDILKDIRCKPKTKKMINDYLAANSTHFETDDGFAEIFLTHCILVIPNFNPQSHLAYDTLGHELMHIIDKSAKAIGVVYSNDEANDNEWHAYMYGFVYGRIMKEILKSIDKVKR